MYVSIYYTVCSTNKLLHWIMSVYQHNHQQVTYFRYRAYKPCQIFCTVRILISRYTFGLSLPKREWNVIATNLFTGQTQKAFASSTVEFVLIKKYNTPEYHWSLVLVVTPHLNIPVGPCPSIPIAWRSLSLIKSVVWLVRPSQNFATSLRRCVSQEAFFENKWELSL